MKEIGGKFMWPAGIVLYAMLFFTLLITSGCGSTIDYTAYNIFQSSPAAAKQPDGVVTGATATGPNFVVISSEKSMDAESNSALGTQGGAASAASTLSDLLAKYAPNITNTETTTPALIKPDTPVVTPADPAEPETPTIDPVDPVDPVTPPLSKQETAVPTSCGNPDGARCRQNMRFAHPGSYYGKNVKVYLDGVLKMPNIVDGSKRQEGANGLIWKPLSDSKPARLVIVGEYGVKYKVCMIKW